MDNRDVHLLLPDGQEAVWSIGSLVSQLQDVERLKVQVVTEGTSEERVKACQSSTLRVAFLQTSYPGMSSGKVRLFRHKYQGCYVYCTPNINVLNINQPN